MVLSVHLSAWFYREFIRFIPFNSNVLLNTECTTFIGISYAQFPAIWPCHYSLRFSNGINYENFVSYTNYALSYKNHLTSAILYEISQTWPGAVGEARTPDPLLKRQMLLPTELQPHIAFQRFRTLLSSVTQIRFCHLIFKILSKNKPVF